MSVLSPDRPVRCDRPDQGTARRTAAAAWPHPQHDSRDGPFPDRARRVPRLHLRHAADDAAGVAAQSARPHRRRGDRVSLLPGVGRGARRRDGLAQEIAAARRAESRDPGARAALRFAATMVQERGHLPTDEAAALRQAGFSDEQLVKIVALVGLNVFRSYFNLALGLGPTV